MPAFAHAQVPVTTETVNSAGHAAHRRLRPLAECSHDDDCPIHCQTICDEYANQQPACRLPRVGTMLATTANLLAVLAPYSYWLLAPIGFTYCSVHWSFCRMSKIVFLDYHSIITHLIHQMLITSASRHKCQRPNERLWRHSAIYTLSGNFHLYRITVFVFTCVLLLVLLFHFVFHM